MQWNIESLLLLFLHLRWDSRWNRRVSVSTKGWHSYWLSASFKIFELVFCGSAADFFFPDFWSVFFSPSESWINMLGLSVGFWTIRQVNGALINARQKLVVAADLGLLEKDSAIIPFPLSLWTLAHIQLHHQHQSMSNTSKLFPEIWKSYLEQWRRSWLGQTNDDWISS